ncbi:hypothetical protein Pfo_014538 [Paulownia fortunei]|nr:hypothetical protein Pfo_014538 [Paulownia fortunei]
MLCKRISASRRYQAAQCLRQMDEGGSEVFPKESTDVWRTATGSSMSSTKVNLRAVHKPSLQFSILRT